jgi:diguanylate cyclase (GGDEF)-like protein
MNSREEQLDVLSRRLSLALDASKVGVWEYKPGSGQLLWDDRMNELYGLPADGAPRGYAHWTAVLHPDDAMRAEREFDEAINVTGRYDSQFRLRLPDGRVRHIRAMGAVYNDAGGARIIGINWDVSADVVLNEDLKRAKALTEARNVELEAAKASIEHNALHDALTGLPNRRYLDQVLEERAVDVRRAGGGMALLHIDLDRFKQINDTLGHAAGDAMLEHAATVLKANVRASDFVARIGGDEFVVVSACKGARSLSRLAERIIEQMHQPIEFQGHECRCGVSVGIAYQRARELDPKRLLIDADIALYRAKSQGRNRSEFFSPALQAEIVSSKRMADEILSAIENNEFVAYFQPQFDAGSLAVSGVEALARWRHPTRGIISPDRFLPIAEDLNVMATIDRMILDQALSAFHDWQRRGLAVPGISVNVSARRLREEGLIEALRSLDIAPGTLSFELVESIYLDERDEEVAWQIDQIKDLGIGIEIDDFGTGYASIVSVLQLRPSRLKIDRQLVMPIIENPERQKLIRSIVEIGHSLGMGVVAEGVETRDHARILTQLGADALQGYAFAPPLSPADFIDFVSRRAWRAA